MVSRAPRGDAGRVTLQTIADRLGVSRMTVSNAFSRPDQLSDALRQRVLSAAAELGYAGPDPAARALARGASGAIGIVLTDSLSYAFSDTVATTFLGAVAEELEPGGIAMTLISLPRDSTAAPRLDVAIDGAIVYSVDADSPVLPWLRTRNVPMVLVDQTPVDTCSAVNVDDRGGARAVARHLADLGHRRVGLLTQGLDGPYDRLVPLTSATAHHVIAERLAGWRSGLRGTGAHPLVANLYRNSLEDAARGAHLVLDAEPRTTALICLSDLMAAGALRAAGERGIRVPHDLSIVGFDDAPLAAASTPPLTTVRQPFAEKGTAAAQAIRGVLAGGAATHVMLPTELVVRESSGPVRR